MKRWQQAAFDMQRGGGGISGQRKEGDILGE